MTAKRSNGQESKIDFGTVVSMLKDGEDVVYVISHDASDVRYANPADLKILPIEAINLPMEIDPWMKRVPTHQRIHFLDALQSASKMKRTPLDLRVQQEGRPNVWLQTSDEDRLHNLTRDIRQSILSSLEPVGQTLMVDPQAVKQGCMKIMDVNRVLCHVVAKIIGLTETHSGLNPSTRKPHRKTPRMVVTTKGGTTSLRVDRTTEFSTPYHERIFKKSTLLEV